MKDAQHHEGVIKRGVATFKHVLKAKLVEGAIGRSALHGASGAVNRGHVASFTGFKPHSLVYGQEYASSLQRQIKTANKNALTSREQMAKYHDKGKTDTSFKVGDKVLVRDPRSGVPRGEPKFLGPFRIIKSKGHSCTLLNKYTGRTYMRNTKDLRHTTFTKQTKTTRPDAEQMDTPNNDDSRQTPITKHAITNTRPGVPTTAQPQSPMKKILTPSPSPSKATL